MEGGEGVRVIWRWGGDYSDMEGGEGVTVIWRVGRG